LFAVYTIPFYFVTQ